MKSPYVPSRVGRKRLVEVLVMHEPNQQRRITAVLKRVYPTIDMAGGPALGFTLTEAGGKLFTEITTATADAGRVQTPPAILLDNRIVTPSLNSVIGESGIIEGNFTASNSMRQSPS